MARKQGAGDIVAQGEWTEVPYTMFPQREGGASVFIEIPSNLEARWMVKDGSGELILEVREGSWPESEED